MLSYPRFWPVCLFSFPFCQVEFGNSSNHMLSYPRFWPVCLFSFPFCQVEFGNSSNHMLSYPRFWPVCLFSFPFVKWSLETPATTWQSSFLASFFCFLFLCRWGEETPVHAVPQLWFLPKQGFVNRDRFLQCV